MAEQPSSRLEVGNEYKLSRGGPEFIRLTAQHYCMIARQGWLLHPTVKEAIGKIPNPQIADVATGNGIWATDLAGQYPEADLIGLDISSAQLPPQWTWAKNVRFDLYDVVEDVPEALQSRFDVVHVRLLVTAGPVVDKAILLDHFRTMLKPGGWLQWEELSWPPMYLARPPINGASILPSLQPTLEIFKVLDKHMKVTQRVAWIPEWEQTLATLGGFDAIKHYTVPPKPEVFSIETEMMFAVVGFLTEVLIKSKKITDEGTLQELHGALREFHREKQEGLMTPYNWHAGIARRC